MSLMDQGDERDIEMEDEDEFFLVQRAALNGLFGSALCPQCKEPGLKMKHGTKHGLAVKMVLTCTACGADAKNAWSSPRMENSKSFEVNIRAMQAIKTIGKGSAALSNFWSVMNVSQGNSPQDFSKASQGGISACWRSSRGTCVLRRCCSRSRCVQPNEGNTHQECHGGVRRDVDDTRPRVPHRRGHGH